MSRRVLLLGTLLLAGCGSALKATEADRIVELLEIEPGQAVADVGAGDGDWTVELARRVGPQGRVFATEVEEDLVREVRDRAESQGLTQVTSLLGDQRSIGLPTACCDALLLRMVYHHFVDPAVMRAELRRALRPGGRLLVIDIEPQSGWQRLPDVPERGGHGIPPGELAAELSADGFELVAHHPRWNGDRDRYGSLFRLAPAAKDRR